MTNIRNEADYLNSLWDWTPYNVCFRPTSIRITDADGMVERNGLFLVLETKRPGAEVPTGQAILFDQLIALGCFSILVIWGETNQPRHWMSWRTKQRYAGNQNDLITMIRKWYLYADKQR